MKNSVLIKPASEKDIADIIFFINKLAEYENLSDKVQLNEKELKKWLFDEKKAEVVFAAVNGIKVGFALYFTNFSTFLGKPGLYLEDLYVLEEFRHKGVGKTILKYLCSKAMQCGYGRVQWSCLNWNKPSIDFYLNMGAEALNDWTVYRLEGQCLASLGDK